MLAIFLSFTLFIFTAYAEESLEQINFDTVEDINQRKEKVLQDLYIKEQKLRWAKDFAKKIKQKDIEESGTFKAFIKRGTILFPLDNSKKYILPKDIYAILFRMQDKEGYQYILSKNGEVNYKVKAIEISNIEVITDLNKRPHYYTPIQIKKTQPFYDEKADYWLETNMITGLALSNVTRDLVNKDDSSFARSFKIEMVPYFDLNFPVYLGLSFQWESMTMSLSGGKAKQEILTVGPSLQTKSFEAFGSPWFFASSVRFSLYGHLSQRETDFSRDIKIHATALELALMKEKRFSKGSFTYGLHYQREWLRAKAEDTSLDLKSQNTFNDIFGLSLGWKWL